MISILFALVAAGAFFDLSFGLLGVKEQEILKDDADCKSVSGEEAVGVGFDLTASYG